MRQGTMTAAVKPLIDKMEEVKGQLQKYKPTQGRRPPRLDWSIKRNKRPYCKKGEECYRQNHDGPLCYWRHAGHLKNRVPWPSAQQK